jgi:hypothetical protein
MKKIVTALVLAIALSIGLSMNNVYIHEGFTGLEATGLKLGISVIRFVSFLVGKF